jgi:hypothetical protein
VSRTVAEDTVIRGCSKDFVAFTEITMMRATSKKTNVNDAVLSLKIQSKWMSITSMEIVTTIAMKICKRCAQTVID